MPRVLEYIKVIISGAIVIHLHFTDSKDIYITVTKICHEIFLKIKNDLLRDIQLFPPNAPHFYKQVNSAKNKFDNKKMKSKANSSHFTILFSGCKLMLRFYYIVIHLLFGIQSPRHQPSSLVYNHQQTSYSIFFICTILILLHIPYEFPEGKSIILW